MSSTSNLILKFHVQTNIVDRISDGTDLARLRFEADAEIKRDRKSESRVTDGTGTPPMVLAASARFLHKYPYPFNSRNLTIMSSIKLTSLNPRFSEVQYAVRGELAIKAEKYVVQLKDHPTSHGLPFDKVVFTNIGNPQQRGLDQEPITFPRQVAALTEWPKLVELTEGKGVFPDDVVERAKELEREIGSIGAYSQSQGASFIRKNVAKFIEGNLSML